MKLALLILGIMFAIVLYLAIGWFVNDELHSDYWPVNLVVVLLWPIIALFWCFVLLCMFLFMFVGFIKDKLGF